MRSIKLPSWTDRLLGLEPVAPPPHVFALDGRELRYGSFRRGERGYVFAATATRELAPGIFPEGVLGAPARDPRLLREEVLGFVAGLAGPIREASLVIPDGWLRLSFTEIGELPRRRREREEILRFKLKRLVPFRVEDLRIGAAEVQPLPTQEEPLRLLLGFAIELLMTQIEDAFAAAGIELGRITNTTLATLSSLEHNLMPGDLAALVMVRDDAYTLSYFRRGEPLVYRYKAIADVASVALASAVRRDLRLTAGFVRQHLPEMPLARVFLAADPEPEETWSHWLFEELGVAPEPLSFEHFQISRTQVGPTWLETAPLVGAAGIEVT